MAIIDGIGNSMKHWTNYIFDVKWGDIINEGAIRYGISEYLVATENFHKEKVLDIGQPKIKDIKFEQVHKIFEKRSVDLYLNVSEGEDDIDVFFEFKYITKCPLPSNESDRYINDLFRLASLAKLSNENKKQKVSLCWLAIPL